MKEKGKRLLKKYTAYLYVDQIEEIEKVAKKEERKPSAQIRVLLDKVLKIKKK